MANINYCFCIFQRISNRLCKTIMEKTNFKNKYYYGTGL